MSRRDARSGDGRRYGSRKKTLFQLVLALSAGRPVFTSDYYAVDGVSGKVASWIDWNDPTHTLSQASAPNQVAVPAAHADFSGQLCATFTALEWYVSSRASSTWSNLHNGIGMEPVLTWTPLSVTAGRVVSTRGTGTQIGFNLAQDVNLALFVHNGTVLVHDIRPGGLVIGTPTYASACYVEGRAPDEATVYLRGALVGTASNANLPTASVPNYTFALGGTAVGALLTPMRWRSLLFMPPLTPSQRALVQQYIQADTGIAA